MHVEAAERCGRRDAFVVATLALVSAAVGIAHRPAASADRDLTAAVTRDGFALLEGATADRHVVEVDRDGQGARRRAVAVIATHARMVGTSAGIAMGWQNADKFEFARVVGDGELGEVQRFGKRVVGLCDGVATSDARWGIAWMEMDGRLWMLHGPVAQRAQGADEVVEIAAAAGPPTWCALTSAGSSIAFVWRDKQKRGFINYCSDRGCSNDVYRLPVSQKHSIEGVACNDAACVLAVRDENGRAVLGWMSPKGKVVWSKPLTDATAESRFSLSAAGPRAFVIGYTTREGATVVRAIEGGSLARAWADPYSHATPAIAWATDRLFVAHRHEGGKIAPEVVPLPQ